MEGEAFRGLVFQKISHAYREVQWMYQEQKIDNVEMYLYYRSIKAERLDAAMARLDAAVNR